MLTREQIAALKYLIAKSTEGAELTKRILWFLISQSSDMTEEVCLTLYADREGYSKSEIEEAAFGLDDMKSSQLNFHLNELMTAMGTEFTFHTHYGDYDPSREGNPFSCAGIYAGWPAEKVSSPDLVLEGQPYRYTFWLNKKPYSEQARLVTVDREALDVIDLAKPELYPSLERAGIR